MGYEGGKLRPWFGSKPNSRFCRDAAREGARAFREAVSAHTPVDTGHLRDSYHDKPLVEYEEPGGRVYESGPYTEVEYAPYVEHGTGLWGPLHAKYPIVPKLPGGTLHWVDKATGQDVFAKKVMHPGSPGAHMFTIAAAETEAWLHLILQPWLERWRYEVEHQNHSGGTALL